MADKKNLPLLLTILAAASALVAWDRLSGSQDKAAVIGAVARPSAKGPEATSAMAVPGAALPALSDIPEDTSGVPALLPRDMFAGKTSGSNPFEGPAPPAPPVTASIQEAPAPPTAPPLPFTLIGRKYEEGRWEVYLAKGDQTYIARADDLIEGTYKVVEVKPPTMTLLYLPTNDRQTMQIGAPTHD